MEALNFFLKANLVFAVLYLSYLLAMRQGTWFTGRRIWLLASALCALVLPAVIGAFGSAPLFTYTLPEVSVNSTSLDQDRPMGVLGTFILLHLGVSALLIVRLFIRVILTYRGLRSAPHDAASFFSWIQLPPNANEADRAAMWHHERVHVVHGHSFDVMLFELLSALFWSNPLWRIALKELRLVHEHTADAEAGRHHPGYDMLLVAQAFGVPSHSLANNFHSSNLKTRLQMMNDPRSPRRARPRLLLALPAILVAATLISWKAVPFTGPAVNTTKVVGEVDKKPMFPGGMDALVQYLGTHVKYPKAAAKAGVEGVCHVEFLVQADGQLKDVTVVRSVQADIDAEALRVAKGMPAWEPATKDGKVVAAKMTLPIAFKLGSQ